MKETILCIGGPYAGEYYNWTTTPEGYEFFNFQDGSNEGLPVYSYIEELPSPQDTLARLAYGYEQHCKAVAERNKTEVHTWGPIKDATITSVYCADTSVMQKELQDSYTASFLRSCRTCIIPSPFGESTPLTLSYGKCYKGYLNEAMEFIVYAGMENYGDPEKSMGRISNPICIVP